MNREHLGTARIPGRWPSFAIACQLCTWLSRRCLPGDNAAWLEAQQEARAHECPPIEETR